MIKDLIVRKMTADDLDAVTEMERTVFEMPWKKDDFAALIDRPDRGCVVALLNGDVAGCVVYHNIVGDVDITNVQVKEGYRRRGIARALMESALVHAREAGGTAFTLEVRVSNEPAIALYESLGFTIEGRRRSFYGNPTEDAFVMWLR
ncbi:MAG: ribosomal protein S18-alanine N-acetyltransferase [Lachnospiraceae bacterium]|nr:ribosomal protein S18-alanine N-acetyltransferase [Lachnospiraceae bacterium]